MAERQTRAAWIFLLGVLCFVAGIYAAPWVLNLEPQGQPVVIVEPAQETSTPRPPPPPHPDEEIFIDLYERLSPKVVNISATQITGSVRPAWTAAERFFYGPFVDTRRLRQSRGSGFLISEDGEIVTNHHVVEGATQIKVALADGRVLAADLVGSDARTDLALLRTKEPPGVEQRVLAIGNPFGLGHSLTTGVLSYKGRSLSDTQDLVGFLQTDMPINPGNSGGPVFDLHGRVVGVNTFIRKDAQGISFAIPVEVVRTVIPALRRFGHFVRGVMGVTFAYPPDPPGVVLAEVLEGFPARQAGLRSGDRILEVNGERVDSYNEIRRLLALTPIGESVSLRVLRGTKEMQFQVPLVPAPQALEGPR